MTTSDLLRHYSESAAVALGRPLTDTQYDALTAAVAIARLRAGGHTDAHDVDDVLRRMTDIGVLTSAQTAELGPLHDMLRAEHQAEQERRTTT